MFERVVEIILFLVSELRSQKQLSGVDVASLSRDGYTQSEISTAFSWLFDQMSVGRPILRSGETSRGSHRILHDIERMVIGTEAYGYLLQWADLGILSQDDVERIIERIMAAGFSDVGIEEMKTFIAGMLFGNEQGIPSGKNLWGGSDTIH